MPILHRFNQEVIVGIICRKLFQGIVFGLMIMVTPLWAQSNSQVNFQIDLSEEISSGIFNPVSDQIFLFGDRVPLSNEDGIQLQPVTEGAAIYTATIDFPAEVTGEELTYKYALRLNGSRVEEPDSPVRRIVLTPGIKRLPTTEFSVEFQLFESLELHPASSLYVNL